ncbi:MAG: ATP-dependent RecD-like DNA helicase, partial [Clostridiales bacterium]|nr:ATP-dependent RecD-like DNA helicase [Clostridiales bacterium]
RLFGGFFLLVVLMFEYLLEKSRFIRLRSGILYTLNKLSESGHCYAVRDQLIGTAAKLLDVDEPELEMTLDEMMRTSDVIIDKVSVP